MVSKSMEESALTPRKSEYKQERQGTQANQHKTGERNRPHSRMIALTTVQVQVSVTLHGAVLLAHSVDHQQLLLQVVQISDGLALTLVHQRAVVGEVKVVLTLLRQERPKHGKCL